MKILVTGGAGFVGSHLVDRLVARRIGEIFVLDNFSRGSLQNLSNSLKDVQLLEGDIRNRTLLRRCMHGIDLVYHLAGQSNVLGAVRDILHSFETNVTGTLEVLRAAEEAAVKRVVFTSSREVYGEPKHLPVPESAPLAPKNAYGASKAAAEMYCQSFSAAGLEVIVFRLSNVYGSRDSDRVIPLFAQQAAAGKVLKVFGTGKILDLVWIEDVVDVLSDAAFCSCPETPVNIGCGKGTKLTELADRISTLTGGHSTVEVSDEREAEVTRFIADITVGRRLFNLRSPDDPMAHLPLAVNALSGALRVESYT